MNLKGKVVIVTGSSSGVGAATVKLLAGKGCSVVINYASSEAAAKKVASECEALGAETLVCQADDLSGHTFGEQEGADQHRGINDGARRHRSGVLCLPRRESWLPVAGWVHDCQY